MPSIGKIIRVILTLGMSMLIFGTLQWLSGTPAAISPASFPKFADLPTYEDAKKKVQDAKTSLRGAFSTNPKDRISPEEPQQANIVTPVSNKSLGPGTGLPDGYVEHAHGLENADDFLPHFKAVTQIPGLLMTTVKGSCDWTSDQKVNYQFEASQDWVKTDRSDGEIQVHRRRWHNFILNDLLPYKDHEAKWNGQGIVIVAGGAKGREQIKVILRALAKVSSSLPVEVHFWDEEITAADRQDILAVSSNVYFNNLKKSPQNIVKTDYSAFVHNYQLKTAAMINSRFAEILLLDSDNVPVIAPEGLFDSGMYKEYGTVFWPDIARTRPNNPIWAITNTKCRKDEFEQESGQLLVNKKKFFYHLQLAAWMNAAKQREYYQKFLLGDKDLFRFAWHALQTPFGKPAKWVKTIGMLHGDMFCGHSFAQHHPDSWNGSIAFVHAGLTKLMPKEFLIWQRETNDGIFQSYQATDKDEDPAAIQSIGLKIDELKYWATKPKSIKFVQCNEMYGLKSAPINDVLPNFDSFFTEIGGYTMLQDYFGGKEP